jgi:hypothetical protein
VVSVSCELCLRRDGAADFPIDEVIVESRGMMEDEVLEYLQEVNKHKKFGSDLCRYLGPRIVNYNTGFGIHIAPTWHLFKPSQLPAKSAGFPES